jgi:hypothetical protein
MDRAEERLFLALAALDFTEKELDSVLRVLALMSQTEIRAAINRYRQTRRSSIGGVQGAESQTVAASVQGKLPLRARADPSTEKIAARIEHLLRKEARLSVDDACHLLIGAFPEARLAVSDEAGKTGLKRWLQRFLTVVPETTLLQFLETYLGRRRSGVESDWSLG